MASSTQSKKEYTWAKSPEDYLNQRLDKTDDCWVFTGGLDKDGYGQVHCSKYAKELGVTRSHQMAYVTWKGPIKDGLFVCHTCDNPSCCNPEHLFLGTALENNKDMWKKGRWVSGSVRKLDYESICTYYGKLPCEQVAEIFDCSFSTVCKIWRKHGLKGRNFFAVKH